MRTAPVEAGKVRLKGLKIDFLSPVTRPAHEGAVALLLKRRDYEKAQHEDPPFSLARRKKRKKDLAAAARRRKRNPCEEAAKARALALGQQLAHPHGKQLEKFDDDDGTVVMTNSVDGHSHLVYIRARAGTTTWQKSEDSEGGHDHPWMLTMADDGSFALIIGDADGHAHDVDARSLNAAFAAAALGKLFDTEDPEDTMTQTKKTDAEVQALETNLDLARIFAGFSDVERSHFSDLAETEKVAFAKMDTTARQVAITAAQASDAVIYTDSAGQVYKQSDDPRLVTLAKRADTDRKASQGLAEGFAQAALEKRATDELEGFPGTPAHKAAMLSALESITDPSARTAALAAMKAGGTAIGKAFDTLGSAQAVAELGLDITPAADDPDSQIAALVAKAMEADPKLTEPKAYDKVAQSAEGRKLYAKVQKGTIDATPLN